MESNQPEDGLKILTKRIVDVLFDQLQPELLEMLEHKLIAVAAEKWRYRWSNEDLIRELIDARIGEMMATTFKPQLDEIAKIKARKKVKEKAARNNIKPEEIGLDLFENDPAKK